MFSPRGRSMIHLQRGPLSTIPPHRWHGGNSKPVLTHPHRDPGEHHLRVVHALNSPTGVVRISRWARKRGETGSTATRALARGAQPCLCDPPKATQFYRPRSPIPLESLCWVPLRKPIANRRTGRLAVNPWEQSFAMSSGSVESGQATTR
jgi:hypothetical protein